MTCTVCVLAWMRFRWSRTLRFPRNRDRKSTRISAQRKKEKGYKNGRPVKCTIYVNAIITRRRLGIPNVCVLGNRDALRGERTVRAKCKTHRGAARPSAQSVIVSFSGFRRSRSSEPHDGVPQGSTERRSSDPRQSATCVVLNQRLRRRRTKYRWVRESIYDFGPRFLAAGKPSPRAPPRSLRQLRGRLQRVRIFTRGPSRRILSRSRDSPQAEASFASCRLPHVLFNFVASTF